MAKAILVMDMPADCKGCRLPGYMSEYGEYYCTAADKCFSIHPEDISSEFKPDWCPLIPAIGYVEPVGNMISWEDDGDE